MDILDLVMKGIIGIDHSYAKKVAKKAEMPEIPAPEVRSITGDGFRLGFSTAEIMPNVESGRTFWIAGHGSGHKMEGILTPVYVSAVWLDCGGDEGILWLTADIIGLTRIEINAIRERILAEPELSGCRHIIYSVTHSHSGIDTLGYWGKPIASVPLNGKDEEYMETLFANSVKVAKEAFAARKPGDLYNGRIEIKDGLFTKRGFIDRHEFLTRLRFAPADGSAETWLMNFGGHPNSLGGSNRMLSGEYPYYMREDIREKCGANVFFTIGAIGGMDVCEMAEDRVECVKLQGKMIADAAEKIEGEEKLEPAIKYASTPFMMPVDNYVLTLLAIIHTMSFKAYPSKRSLTGVETMSEMTLMTIGSQKLVTLPGESFVSTVYGSYMDADTAPTGKGGEINPEPLCEICGDSSIIAVGNTNDMTGYVVPPNDFILNPTQPFLNGVKDKNGLNHYHETNSMGIHSQQVIADTFRELVKAMEE